MYLPIICFPDPDPWTQMNEDPSGSGFTSLLFSCIMSLFLCILISFFSVHERTIIFTIVTEFPSNLVYNLGCQR